MHVGFLLLLGFALIGNLRAATPAGRAWFWLLGLLGFGTGLYNWVFYADLIRRSGFLTTRRPGGGDAAHRAGLRGGAAADGAAARDHRRALPRLLLLRPAPAAAVHPPRLRLRQIVDHFAFGTEGIYGTPVYVSAAYIFIFVLFAAFLERAGMIALFNDVALGLVGGWRGGPAQVCVLSSALMGTISGSGVANVVAAGSSPSR